MINEVIDEVVSEEVEESKAAELPMNTDPNMTTEGGITQSQVDS